MQSKNYTVAGHTFRLRMETTSPLWESLAAYTSFETRSTDTEAAPIFTLSILIEDIKKTKDDPEESSTLIGHFDSEVIDLTLFHTIEGGRLFLISNRWAGPDSCCRLRINPDYQTATLVFPATSDDTTPQTRQLRSYGLTNVLMLLYAFTTATRHTVLAHASVVMNSGVAYAFLGRSGTGKSTHTGLWLQHIPGSELLNDDNPVIRIEGGIARIYGSPWSGKTPCYRNMSAPLGGIVRLGQASQNSIALLKNAAAYAAILPSLSVMKWEREMANGIHDTLTQLLGCTKAYYLPCLPDEAAAQLSAQTLQREVSCVQ